MNHLNCKLQKIVKKIKKNLQKMEFFKFQNKNHRWLLAN